MTENEFVRHIPCDKCGSSDGNSLYSDGHTFCFVCPTRVGGDEDGWKTALPGGLGATSSAAIKNDGTLWSWGYNQSRGQLGHNNTTNYSSPKQVPGIWGFTSATGNLIRYVNTVGISSGNPS